MKLDQKTTKCYVFKKEKEVKKDETK